MIARRRSAAVHLTLVPVLLLALGACTQARTPDEATLAARERVRSGLDRTAEAHSARLEYWMSASTDGDEGATTCFDMAWDTQTYPEERHDLHMGTGPDLEFGGTCTGDGTGFSVRGDVVYVAQRSAVETHREMFGDLLPVPQEAIDQDAQGPRYRWARISPEALAEAVPDAGDNDRFHQLVATGTLVRDRWPAADDDDRLVFDLDWDTLADAGLVQESELGTELDGRITFGFTGDALTRVDLEMTGDGVSVRVRQVYSGLDEPHELAPAPTGAQLLPESPPITSGEEMEDFLALA